MSNFTGIVAAYSYFALTSDPFSNQTQAAVVQFYGHKTTTKSKTDTVFNKSLAMKLKLVKNTNALFTRKTSFSS